MPLPYYRDAVRGQIQAAAHDALHPEESADPLDVCQAIQDALDVLKFAMERQAEEKGDGDAR